MEFPRLWRWESRTFRLSYGVASRRLREEGSISLVNIKINLKNIATRIVTLFRATGLYRLCGSATKKRILREAFERNARSVNLSPDNVPDINVITGNAPRIKYVKLFRE